MSVVKINSGIFIRPVDGIMILNKFDIQSLYGNILAKYIFCQDLSTWTTVLFELSHTF